MEIREMYVLSTTKNGKLQQALLFRSKEEALQNITKQGNLSNVIEKRHTQFGYDGDLHWGICRVLLKEDSLNDTIYVLDHIKDGKLLEPYVTFNCRNAQRRMGIEYAECLLREPEDFRGSYMDQRAYLIDRCGFGHEWLISRIYSAVDVPRTGVIQLS